MARRSLRHIINQRVSQEEMPRLIAELRDMHDRAAGIVAATLVEGALEHLLASQMARLSKEEYRRLFSGDAALSTFSAKIRVARAFKVIDKSTAKELNAIKEIRNVFAHAQVSVSFKTPEIIDQINILDTVDQQKDPIFSAVNSEYSKLINLLATNTPRLKYLSNCVFHIMTFRLLPPSDPDLMDDDEP